MEDARVAMRLYIRHQNHLDDIALKKNTTQGSTVAFESLFIPADFQCNF